MTIERAYELVELAGTYLADGALRTAALRLRSAADVLDEITSREEREMAAPQSEIGA